MDYIDVSVIIPVRNRPLELALCLEALRAQSFPVEKYEVLVCDDGSDDGIREIVEQHESSGLKVYYLRQEPKGPAAARNLGISHATAPIVAMTDSDTVPHKDWLAKLVESLRAHPQAVAAEGKVMPEHADEFELLGEGPTNLTGGVFLTCNCAYRRHILIAAGGFDESFPYPAYEDVELAARAQQWGEIIWQPEAIVYHPRRQLTLATVMKKLRHWEYVLIMGCRYGYLGWRQYPVKQVALRVILLSVLALPLAKFKIAANGLLKQPANALKLCWFGVVESLGALFIVVPRVISGKYRCKVPRQNYFLGRQVSE